MSENRLGRETSPYLLQHKDNPVHWWAWGPDALAEARRTDKPILLSIGYAACHWCHVMAHESFEDPDTAAVMNDLFVNIKVDREERPDIDAIYMAALHRMGEHGGWPMTMFLDSEARPFWGGTYFPKTARWGKPAFTDVLRAVSAAYRAKPEEIARAARQLTAALAPRGTAAEGTILSESLLADLTGRMTRAVDPQHGGIKGAPKFPQWSFFWLLWRGAIRYGHAASQTAALTTFTHLCQGGIYDHLGGGISRYSVDGLWLVPHFEKMLPDNALLISLLTEAWRETRDPLYEARIAETAGWLLREMVAEGGGFAASIDADSEGEEGRFYVWTENEIRDVLGADDAAFFGKVYGVSAEGNWEGRNILNRLGSLKLLSGDEERRLAVCREKLFARRAARVRPGWDDKVLADWNGLAISALARAAQVFGKPAWRDAAERAFTFVADAMTRDGQLRHAWRRGEARAPAVVSDYAFMIRAALHLHEATLEPRYLDAARNWAAVLGWQYWYEPGGGYAATAAEARDVIVRLRSAADDATPNANAVMVSNLVALSAMTGDPAYAARAEAVVNAFTADVSRSPLEHTGMLAGVMDILAPHQVVISGSGDGAAALAAALYSVSLPGGWEFKAGDRTGFPGGTVFAGKGPANGRPAAYACLGTACSPPVTEAAALRQLLLTQRRRLAGSEASPSL